jgi:hypothetical protein
MVSYLRTPKQFLVLSILTTGDGGSGTSSYTATLATNAALASAYPSNYLDIRRHLIDNGLGEEGITPTAQDTADIAADTVPTSLRFDNTHPNAAGIKVIARKVAQTILDKGWWPADDVYIPAAQNVPKRLPLTSTSSFVSMAASTAVRLLQSFSLRMLVLPDAFPPAVNATWARRYSTTDTAQHAWQFFVLTTGKPRVQYFPVSANTAITNDSTVAAVYTPGTPLWLRADVNAAASSVSFYTSTDNTTWTQLGSAIANTASAIDATGTAPVEFGGYAATSTASNCSPSTRQRPTSTRTSPRRALPAPAGP